MKKRRCGNKGMTLIEVLFALMIIAIAMAGLLSSISAILSFIQLSQDRSIAYADIENIAERMRSTAYANMLTVFPNNVANGTGGLYATIVGGYTLPSESIRVNYANTAADPLEARITLTWQDNHLRNQTVSVITCKAR